MAGRCNHLDIQHANFEMITISNQHIKLSTLAGDIKCVENRTEDLLHFADMLADQDFRSGF